jgi:hypothetical protein
MKLRSGPDNVRIVYLKTDPLTEEQMNQAFTVSEQTLWWRALMQILEESRHFHAQRAASFAAGNNAMAAAHDSGIYEFISELMDQLEKRRSKSES